MTYDYNKLYGETPDALGLPTGAFVDFFDRYEHRNARVLDVGCGQGRDALFIARRGHRVVGVDLSPNGIRDLVDVAKREELAIEGVFADITCFTPPGVFDVIIADRTLHMLTTLARLSVLSSLLDHVDDSGWMLIADEPSNLGGIEDVIAAHDGTWRTELKTRGFLFVRRA